MKDPVVVTLVTVLLIVLSAFFVIIEFALMGARRHALEERAVTSRAARAALRGVNELTIMLAVAQLGITACTFALGAVTKPAVAAAIGPGLLAVGVPGWVAGGFSFALALLLVTFLHLVVGEMAPKSWAIAHPERAATLVGLPARAVARILRPLLTWVNTMANRLVAASGVEPADRAAIGGQDADTIRQLVDHSASVGALDTAFRSQISRVLDLDRIVIGDIVPPGPPTKVPAGASVADVQEAAVSSGHLRILVEGDGGEPLKQVHVRDTLREPGERSVSGMAREVLHLQRGTPLHEALTRMRTDSEQLVAVAEGEEFIGVVTIQDVLRRVLPLERAAGV